MKLPSRYPPVFLAGLLLGAVVAGCSSSTPMLVEKPIDATQEKLLWISAAYNQFAAEKGRPPASAEDLKPILSRSGNADEILRSSRDGQPLVICWGIDLLSRLDWVKPKTTPVLAYERRGADGSRYVLSASQGVDLLSEQQFRDASFPPGHQPAF
jgi:hypothetical protein